jgi:hypothetical protein
MTIARGDLYCDCIVWDMRIAKVFAHPLKELFDRPITFHLNGMVSSGENSLLKPSTPTSSASSSSGTTMFTQIQNSQKRNLSRASEKIRS